MRDRRIWSPHFNPDFARAGDRVLGGSALSPKKPPPALCGAKTRKGTLCKAKPLPGKTRCKFHGGASTGPKTPDGRERIAEAQRQRWAKWRAQKHHSD